MKQNEKSFRLASILAAHTRLDLEGDDCVGMGNVLRFLVSTASLTQADYPRAINACKQGLELQLPFLTQTEFKEALRRFMAEFGRVKKEPEKVNVCKTFISEMIGEYKEIHVLKPILKSFKAKNPFAMVRRIVEAGREGGAEISKDAYTRAYRRPRRPGHTPEI